MAHVEPNDDEEHQIADSDMGNLELCSGLLIEIEVAVDPAELHKKEIRKMKQKAGDDEVAFSV